MEKQKQQGKKPKKFRAKYMQYSSMAFELMAACLFGWWVGGLLDEYFENEKAIATAFCILFFLVASMTKTIMSLIKLSKKQ